MMARVQADVVSSRGRSSIGRLELDVREAVDFLALIARAPEISREELSAGATEILELLTMLIQERTPKGATHLLRGSITHEVSGDPTAEGILGAVYSPLAYAAPVELGTRPHWPPLDPLIDWVRAKLGVADEDEARAVARRIQFKIAARGTQGAHMFEQGFEAGADLAENILSGRVERIIERAGQA
jgi:hypothetical protein